MLKFVLLVLISAITTHGFRLISEAPIWEDYFKFAIRAEFDAGITTTYYGTKKRTPGMPPSAEQSVIQHKTEGYGIEAKSYTALHVYISILDFWEITYSGIFIPFLVMPFAVMISWS